MQYWFPNSEAANRPRDLLLFVSALIVIILTQGCAVSGKKSEKDYETPYSELPGEFVSFCLDPGGYLLSDINVDEFISQKGLSGDSFYTRVIRPLLDDPPVENKMSPCDMLYRFQGTLGERVSFAPGSLSMFIKMLAGDYLTARGISLSLYDDDKEFKTACDIVYELNTIPGNWDMRLTLIRYLGSDNATEYNAACAYLRDKKIKLGGMMQEFEGKFKKEERGGKTVWWRIDLGRRKACYVLVEEDEESFFYSRSIER